MNHEPRHALTGEAATPFAETDAEFTGHDLLLRHPGQDGHWGHPAVWLARKADGDDLLFGRWVCLAHNDQLIHDAVAEASREYGLPLDAAVHDHDGFGDWTPEPGTTLSEYAAIARGIREHGSAFAAWADLMVDPDMIEHFEAYYDGTYRTVAAWAERTYKAAIQTYLAKRLPHDLATCLTVDYNRLAEEATAHQEICFYPSRSGVIHAFTIERDPSDPIRPDRGEWPFTGEAEPSNA